MNSEPTNQELKDTFEQHAKADLAFQTEQKSFNEEAEKSRAAIHKRLAELPTKEDLARVATKEDTDELKQILKAARITAGIFTFTFDNSAKIGQLLFLVLAVIAFVKYGIVGAIAWLFNKTP